MPCLDYRRWLSPYIDKQLPPEQRRELDAHLAGCAGCRDELASLQGMLSTLQTLEAPAAPELLAGIHAKLQPAPARRRVPFLWPGLALAAATALVVLAVAVPKTVQQGPMQVASWKQEEYAAAPQPLEQAARGVAERESLNRAQGRSDEAASTPPLALEQPLASASRASGFLADRSTQEPAVTAGAPAMRMEADQSLVQNAAVSSVVEAKAVAAPAAAASANAQRPTATVLQVQWQSLDAPAARHQVGEWVEARHGFSVATDERHLSIHLPASEIPAFLQQFASNAAALPPVDPGSPLWVTVSLELVPAP